MLYAGRICQILDGFFFCQGLIQHTGLDAKSLPQFLGGDRTDGDFPEVLPVPQNALKYLCQPQFES